MEQDNRKIDLGGGLGLTLPPVTVIHKADTANIVKTALYILLIWAGLKITIEIVKYLLSK